MLSIQICINLLLIIFVNAKTPTYKIGVLLDYGEDEAELAFRTAVDKANIFERSFQLVPIIEKADISDSFTIEKRVCNLISQNVIAIFGPNSAGSTDIVDSICNTFDIPHILFDWSASEALDEKPHKEMTLNLHPDNLLFSQGIAEIVKSFGWRSFTLVYETDKELLQLQDVLQMTEPGGTPTTVLQLPSDTEDYRPFLKGIKTSTDNCLILHCVVDKILGILKQANDLKMLGEYQSIFIPGLDTHTLDFQELLGVGANITTIRIMDPTDYQVQNLVREWEDAEKKNGKYYRVDPGQVKTNMILISDAVGIFVRSLAEINAEKKVRNPRVKCDDTNQWRDGRRVMEFLRQKSDEVSTGRIDFNQYGQRSFFTLRCMELGPSGLVDLATWDPVNGFTPLGGDDASDKRATEKLQNKTFIITSRIGAPFLMHREPAEGEVLEGNARYEGYSLDLIDAIAKFLNFKYEFQLAPDGKYGGFNKVTRQWDGLVRQLLDGNADLGICDLTMTSARRQAVDFTPPFMTLGISILYVTPEVKPPNLFSFLLPFSMDVWIYMATGYLGVSLLLFVLSRMAPDDWENPHPCKEPEEYENLWTITNTTWLTMGSIMGQGCDILPKASSTRLVTGIWWFFALMMLNSYTANLAAFLTMSRMGSSIKSAEDLAAQNKIKYGAVMGGSTMSFFKDSNFTTYQRMWASMESDMSVFTKSNDEGVERVLKGKRLYAYLMESTSLEYIIERNCDLVQIGGWLDYKTYGVAMPFNSPYRKQISGAVLKLGESGTLAELKRKWWKEMHGGGKCATAAAASSDTPELDLESVGGVFLVLGVGLLIAHIMGIVEFLWNVKTVAVDEKITPWEALKLETIFALKFWIATKPVHASSDHTSSKSSSSSSSSKSGSSNSKRSSKSLGVSTSHSVKSHKSSIAENVRTSVHDKLRKISSLFSLKSSKSDKHDNEIEAPPLAQQVLARPIPPPLPALMPKSSLSHPMTEDKGVQIELKRNKKHHHHHTQLDSQEDKESDNHDDGNHHNDPERKARKRESKISSKSHLNA